MVAEQPSAVSLLGGSPRHDRLRLGGRPRGRPPPRAVDWASPSGLVLFCARDPVPSFWALTCPLGGAAVPLAGVLRRLGGGGACSSLRFLEPEGCAVCRLDPRSPPPPR